MCAKITAMRVVSDNRDAYGDEDKEDKTSHDLLYSLYHKAWQKCNTKKVLTRTCCAKRRCFEQINIKRPTVAVNFVTVSVEIKSAGIYH